MVQKWVRPKKRRQSASASFASFTGSEVSMKSETASETGSESDGEVLFVKT